MGFVSALCLFAASRAQNSLDIGTALRAAQARSRGSLVSASFTLDKPTRWTFVLKEPDRFREVSVDGMTGRVVEVLTIEYDAELTTSPFKESTVNFEAAATAAAGAAQGAIVGAEREERGWEFQIQSGTKLHEVVANSEKALEVDGKTPGEAEDKPVKPTVVLDDAVQSALVKMTGRIYSVALNDEDPSTPFWDIELVGASQKAFRTRVDAKTGEVLEVVRYEFSKSQATSPITLAPTDWETVSATCLKRIPGWISALSTAKKDGRIVWEATVVDQKGEERELVLDANGPKIASVDGKADAKAASSPKIAMMQAAKLLGARAKGILYSGELDSGEAPSYRFTWKDGSNFRNGEVDAVTGAILRISFIEFSEDMAKDPPKAPGKLMMDAAVAMALRKVPGLAISAQTDSDEGQPEWNVEILAGGKKHELTLNGQTSQIESIDGKDQTKDRSSRLKIRRRPRG